MLILFNFMVLNYLKVPHSSKRKKSSDSSAWFTGIESNDNYAADERIAKRHKEVKVYYVVNIILCSKC